MIIKDNERNILKISDEITFEESGTKGDFREKMLLNNHIEGLLEFRINIINHEKVYEYNTEGLSNLNTLCKKESVKGNKLGMILTEIASIILRGEKYLLDEANFILDPQYIFLDKEEKPVLAYYSGYKKPFAGQLTNLAEYFMNRIDYHDHDGVLTVYTVYMKSREEGFTVRELLEFMENGEDRNNGLLIQEEKKEKTEPDNDILAGNYEPKLFDPFTESVEKNTGEFSRTDEKKEEKISGGRVAIIAAVAFFAVVVAISVKFRLIYGKDQRTDVLRCFCVLLVAGGGGFYLYRILDRKMNGKNKNTGKDFHKEIIPESDDATELLFDADNGQKKNDYISLVSENGSKITIKSFPFYIGKDESHMDFCLNAPGISRYHMKVESISGKTFISDLNSTNGTYINGKKLEPNIKEQAVKGDEIRLGKCIYHVE